MEGIDGVTAAVDALVRTQIQITKTVALMENKQSAFKYAERKLFEAKLAMIELINEGEGVDASKPLAKLILTVAEEIGAADRKLSKATKIEKQEIAEKLKQSIKKAKEVAVKAIKRAARP